MTDNKIDIHSENNLNGNEPPVQRLGRIKNVYKGTWRLMLGEYRVFSAVLLTVSISLFLYEYSTTRWLEGAPQAVLVLWGMYGVIVFSKVKTAFMKQFARDKGLVYTESGDADSVSGRLFSVGRSKRLSHILTGTFETLPMRLFNYQYTIGSGKHKQTRYFTCMEIAFPKTQFPFILLRSKTMRRFGSRDWSGEVKDRKVSLEDGFDDFFQLYASGGYETEALQIFTPEILTMLRDSESKYSIEFADSKMYIYDDVSIYTDTHLNNFYTIAHKLYASLTPFLQRLHDDFDALHPYYRDKDT